MVRIELGVRNECRKIKILFLSVESSELPGAPSNLVISSISPRTATLRFRPGPDGKTAISQWIVEGQVCVSVHVQTVNLSGRSSMNQQWASLTGGEEGWKGRAMEGCLPKRQPARCRLAGDPQPHSLHSVQVSSKHSPHSNMRADTHKLIHTHFTLRQFLQYCRTQVKLDKSHRETVPSETFLFVSIFTAAACRSLLPSCN